YSVSVSSLSGPSRQSFFKLSWVASEASSKVSRAIWKFSRSSLAIPTCCDPWPGKRATIWLISFSLDSQQRRPIRQARSENGHQYNVSRLHSAIANRFIQRCGDGRCRRVAIAVEIHQHAIHGEIQALGRRFDNSEIGLMGNDPIDIFQLHSVVLKRLNGVISYGFHCDFVDLFPLHLHL